ncbi:PREDICTED: glycine-rich cell wall structural protein 1.0-like [Camelina sativa]|uniref:Glycine-rich cell wall structural protein 1.0-like n=1 Tax=Camelina sativa TaxID=90675 RepID=A0ABM0TUE2_CAMSA|nr:PREDICTED: glycine-rich cell wall structural protein 1.0-like [Camelina sativa]
METWIIIVIAIASCVGVLMFLVALTGSLVKDGAGEDGGEGNTGGGGQVIRGNDGGRVDVGIRGFGYHGGFWNNGGRDYGIRGFGVHRGTWNIGGRGGSGWFGGGGGFDSSSGGAVGGGGGGGGGC